MPDLKPLFSPESVAIIGASADTPHLARPNDPIPDRARLSRPYLSGDAQPAGGVRPQKLRECRRIAGNTRPRCRHRAGGLCRADVGGMRAQGRARRGRDQLRLCRGARRGGAGARQGLARGHRPLRHRRLRAQFGRPRQPAKTARRDLQSGVPRPGAEPVPRKPQEPGDRGQLPERCSDLRVFEPRPAAAIALYLPGKRRQPDLPGGA